MKHLIITFTFISFFVLQSCGFKRVNQNLLNNFEIAEINMSGESRVNYKLKNKILFISENNNENLIVLNIETKKNKTIKEKNIKNEITKYNISITAKIETNIISSNNIVNFTVIENAESKVNNQYSKTINNEKRAIDEIVNKLSIKIIDELRLSLNDL